MAIKLSPSNSFLAVGKKENQEDALWPVTPCANSRVLILCDGMGGHKDGEVASSCVIEALKNDLSSCPIQPMSNIEPIIKKSIVKACKVLESREDTSISGKTMGTTLAMMVQCSDGILVCHVGDSRVYQIRKSKGIIFRSRDHSVVAELIACGEMTEEEARTSPLKNRITKAIQPHLTSPVEPSFDRLTDIQQNDVFFLCSDGIIEQITDAELSEILSSSKDLAARIEDIRQLCGIRQTRDNHSCIAVQVIDGYNSRKQEKISVWQKIVNILSR